MPQEMNAAANMTTGGYVQATSVKGMNINSEVVAVGVGENNPSNAHVASNGVDVNTLPTRLMNWRKAAPRRNVA